MARPRKRPIRGIIVTHFSLGSFFVFQGWVIVPFGTLLEWKYRWETPPRMAEEAEETGLELNGDEKGFGRGFGEMPSSNGFTFLPVSGVPGLMGLAVRVVAVVVALPR